MRSFCFTLCLLTITFFGNTQPKLLTIEDALVNNRTTLSPENLKQLQFIKGTDDYAYLKNVNGRDVFVRGNFKSATESVFFSLSELNNRFRAMAMDTLKSWPPVSFEKDNLTVTVKGQKTKFALDGKQSETIIDKELAQETGVDRSSDGYIAYTDSFNLYIAKGSQRSKITSDGSADIVYASTVHQSEFGISKGTFWSNNGKLLAFYRMDQSMVPDYPIIDWSVRPAKVTNIRYPMTGDKSHHVTVALYNTTTSKTTWIKTQGPAEQYLTNIAWSPDDKFLYIAVLNREQNHMWLNQYNAGTGDFVKTLFEETDSKYVEPLVPMLFAKNNPSQFIWQSRRDGWNHLYLYNSDGTLIRQLTKGQWEVLEVKGFDEKGETLFYSSTAISPLSKNLSKVELKSGKSQLLTNTNAVHASIISSSGKYVIDNFSDPSNPRTIQLTEVKSGKTKLLHRAKSPLDGYALGEMKIFTLDGAAELYCRLYKPVNFDSTRKYPVIVYWYGGPHAQLILQSWNGGASDYWFQYMAERGYLVLTIDTRGSANRGRDFEQSIFRNAGEVQMQDMLTAVNYLQQLPFADKENMGLFGWSYGGFLTTDFMLTNPGIFKAAVAGGPVTDWKYYEIMYTERYMDTPAENGAGFEASDLTKKIANLKGKLLLIHGLQDPVVVQQHSVRLVRAAIDKGVQVDYMIYPGHEHNVIGKDRSHLYQKVTDYFSTHLK